MHTSEFYVWIKQLHRSLLQATLGQIVVGINACMLLVLIISGMGLTIKRQGGLRHYLSRPKGQGLGYLHTLFGQLSIIPLIILAITGMYLSGSRFELLPASTQYPAYPESLQELSPVAASQLPAFANLPMSSITAVIFPIPEDWFDVYTIKTPQGYAFYDQFTGELLSTQAYTFSKTVMDWVMLLHTGQGQAWLALIMGLAALCIPLFSISGVMLWYRQRTPSQTTALAKHNSPHLQADAVILVGSESQSTWQFAASLNQTLRTLGFTVHQNELNAWNNYPKAQYLFVLTSTYGDGQAPSNADRFLQKLHACQHPSHWQFCVLGFGDSQFPKFCYFADQVMQALLNKATPLLPSFTIDRQCRSAFKEWGVQLGQALKQELALEPALAPTHQAPKQSLSRFTLIDRQDYFSQDHHISTLRFSYEKRSLLDFRRAGFQAGDLLAISPMANERPRFYSLASSAKDGWLEICVKRVADGVCSNYLHKLTIGDSIQAHIQSNPNFHFPTFSKTAKRNAALILIGAGTGIGPLIGMVRNNQKRRPLALYFGCRHPTEDYLYQTELANYLDKKQLQALHVAFSRYYSQQQPSGEYVQDQLLQQSQGLIQQLNQGAIIMVCGSRLMAQGVEDRLDDLLNRHSDAVHGLTVAQLKADKRYLQDVY